ncbi:unnamed protein product [Caretta caretta]
MPKPRSPWAEQPDPTPPGSFSDAAPQERGPGDIRGAEDAEGTPHVRRAPGLLGAVADAGGQRGRWLGTGTTVEPGSWVEASGAAGIPRKATLAPRSPLKQGVVLA